MSALCQRTRHGARNRCLLLHRAAAFGPVLEPAEVVNALIAHVFENLAAERRATAGAANTSLSLAKLLSCEGESGSARNSSRPRDTFTAPAILPLFSTSGASRTSTIRVLPCATMSRACAGVIRGTAALAASIISFKFVVMCAPPTPRLYLDGGRPGRSIDRRQDRSCWQFDACLSIAHIELLRLERIIMRSVAGRRRCRTLRQ